ncbi:hypothetical protein [Streptomyces sp. A5-4]|uniref:hypothetical protein n=1 Tax=Streptomyces sp. A5-4 TaxID=3384771 RepID=UPI003DA7AB72
MDFEKENPPARQEPARGFVRLEPERADGCLTAVIRIPVRVVVLVLFVPVRMIWDLLTISAKASGRALATVGRVLLVVPAGWLYEHVLVPVAKALGYVAYGVLVLPWIALWKYVVVPGVRYGIVVPVVWVYRRVLSPVGHGLAWLARGLGFGIAAVARGVGAAVVWLVVTLLVVPVVWVVMMLLVKPVVWFWRAGLAPVGREIAAAAGHGWRIAGYISRAVGRALKWLGWNLLGRPVRWAWLSVCTPVGHWVRDAGWAPAKRAAVEAGRGARAAVRAARETVRQARQDAWRALVGGARHEVRTAPEPAVADAREPLVSPARTLGGKTIAPSAAPAPEISLLGESTAKQG